MEYTLMHRNLEVADVSIDSYNGAFSKMLKVQDRDRLPVGTVMDRRPDQHRFNEWWSRRSIPSNRRGIRDFLQQTGLPDTKALLTRCMGLSLSDQYWIRPSGSKIEWSDVNFFDNPFSDDIGDLLMGHPVGGSIDMSSPHNTSDGVLRKRWKIVDGERCLVKEGQQESFNEVIASMLAETMGIDHVEYEAFVSGDHTYCVCRDFIDRDTELVSASSIISSTTVEDGVSVYDHYVDNCNRLGVDVVPALDRMIVLDFIMANGDRHLNNLGLVRNAETLECLGAAPVFDTGSSLGAGILNLDNWTCPPSKPFRRTFEEQLDLVSSLDWFDPDSVTAALPGIREMLRGAEPVIPSDRADRMVEMLEDRVGMIG